MWRDQFLWDEKRLKEIDTRVSHTQCLTWVSKLRNMRHVSCWKRFDRNDIKSHFRWMTTIEYNFKVKLINPKEFIKRSHFSFHTKMSSHSSILPEFFAAETTTTQTNNLSLENILTNKYSTLDTRIYVIFATIMSLNILSVEFHTAFSSPIFNYTRKIKWRIVRCASQTKRQCKMSCTLVYTLSMRYKLKCDINK